jgi:hypothetical protein
MMGNYVTLTNVSDSEFDRIIARRASPLYISVHATNPAGENVTFLPPLEYARCSDPEKHWTLQPEGESAGRCSFFVKGEIPEACSLAEAREKYDYVYVVAGWQLHDYGSRALQHYEVVSKVSSRYYQYGN